MTDTVKIWKKDENGIFKHLQTLRDHKDSVTFLGVQNDLFITASDDESLKIWRKDEKGLFTCLMSIEVSGDFLQGFYMKDGQVLIGHYNGNVVAMDFNATHHQVFLQIAEQLGRPHVPEEQLKHLKNRILKMPKIVLDDFFLELSKLLDPSLKDPENPFWAENAFHAKIGMDCTPWQIHAAIRSYLQNHGASLPPSLNTQNIISQKDRKRKNLACTI